MRRFLLSYYHQYPQAFSQTYLSELRGEISASPYFAINNLNRDFVGTKGFSLVFRRSHLAEVKQRFPYFKLYLARSLQPECNAFYLNPLLLKLGSRVDPHIDRSLRSYCEKNRPSWCSQRSLCGSSRRFRGWRISTEIEQTNCIWHARTGTGGSMRRRPAPKCATSAMRAARQSRPIRSSPMRSGEHPAARCSVSTPIWRPRLRQWRAIRGRGDVSAIQPVNTAQREYVERYIAENLPALKGIPVISAVAPFKLGFGGATDFTAIDAGPLAIRNAADLYLYPNTLAAVKPAAANWRPGWNSPRPTSIASTRLSTRHRSWSTARSRATTSMSSRVASATRSTSARRRASASSTCDTTGNPCCPRSSSSLPRTTIAPAAAAASRARVATMSSSMPPTWTAASSSTGSASASTWPSRRTVRTGPGDTATCLQADCRGVVSISPSAMSMGNATRRVCARWRSICFRPLTGIRSTSIPPVGLGWWWPRVGAAPNTSRRDTSSAASTGKTASIALPRVPRPSVTVPGPGAHCSTFSAAPHLPAGASRDAQIARTGGSIFHRPLEAGWDGAWQLLSAVLLGANLPRRRQVRNAHGRTDGCRLQFPHCRLGGLDRLRDQGDTSGHERSQRTRFFDRDDALSLPQLCPRQSASPARGTTASPTASPRRALQACRSGFGVPADAFEELVSGARFTPVP